MRDAISEVMAELARRRWAKATPAQRKAQGQLLLAGRRKARKAKGGKCAKSKSSAC